MPGPQLSVDQQRIADISRALKQETDGKALRKELMRDLKQVVDPGVGRVKGAVLALPTTGAGQTEGGGLRQAIAQQVKPEVKLSGRYTGVNVKVRGRNMPRGFRFAARRLNSPNVWRHKVFGRDVWVEQSGIDPGWFEREIQKDGDEYQARVLSIIESMADRIASRAGSD